MSMDRAADRTRKPAFLVVDDDQDTAEALRSALCRRFEADYEVYAISSARAAVELLEGFCARHQPLAVVIAALSMPEMTGVEVLVQVRRLHPDAGRALLLEGFSRRETELVSQAMAMGRTDSWIFKPWEPAERNLFPRVSELLADWVEATGQPAFHPVRVVADAGAPRTHELRDMLVRNDVAAEFLAPDSPSGQALLDAAGVDGSRLPVAVYWRGLVQVQPSLGDIAGALGVPARPSCDDYDVTIVGAGPAGLSAALCSASEGLHTLLLEPRSFGGQAGSTSLIRNYLGFPRGVTGRQLASMAYDQCMLFGAESVFDRAERLDVRGDRLILTLGNGGRVTSRSVVISVGVDYRRLGAPGVEELIGSGVFYGAAVSEAPAVRGHRVCIVGAGNSAGQAAVHLAKFAEHVTIVIRGPSLSAAMSDYLVKEIEAAPNISVRLNTQVVAAGGDGHLEHLTLRTPEAPGPEQVDAAALFIMIGARPQTDWLADTVQRDDLGFILTGPDLMDGGTPPAGWTLARPPLPMETSVPGVFAVGDVRGGSTKRVASAVGAGSIAIHFVHQFLAAR